MTNLYSQYFRFRKIISGNKKFIKSRNCGHFLQGNLQETSTAISDVDVDAAVLWDQSDQLLHRPDLPERWGQGVEVLQVF